MNASHENDETVEVITIYSDDDDQEDSPDFPKVTVSGEKGKGRDQNHDSSIVSPQIEDGFLVEEYFLPPHVHSSNNHSHDLSSKNSLIGTSEKNSTMVQTFISKEHSHSIPGNINPYQNTEENIRISGQVLAADYDDKQKRLKRLAEGLLKVVSLSNVEKTILNVSKSDFDISDFADPRHNKEFSHSQNVSFPQKTYSSDSSMGTFDKSIPPDESHILGPNKQSTQVKKRGRPLGWLKNKTPASKLRIKEQPSLTHINKNCGRPFVCRKSETKIIIHNAVSRQSNLTSSPQNTMNVTSSREESCNLRYTAERNRDITCSVVQSVFDEKIGIIADNCNISGRKRQDTNLEHHELSSLETSPDAVKKNSVTYQQNIAPVISEFAQLCSNTSVTSMNIADRPCDLTTQEIHKSYCHEDLNVGQGKEYCEELCRFLQNSESTNNVVSKGLDEKVRSVFPTEPTPISKISFNQLVDTEIESNQADFVTCYNRIFDDYVTNLCMKMSDIILLAIKEEQTYRQRLLAVEKITCELQEQEKEILKTSFLTFHNKYKITFTTMFGEIVANILSNVSTTKLQQTFIFAWFLKLFLKITDLSPELSDSLILIWSKTTDLLSNYENPIPMIREIFSLSEVEFELECYKTLDLTLLYFPDESDPNANGISELVADETATSEPREKSSDSLPCPTMQSSVSHVNGHKHTIKTSNNNYLCHQTNGTKINLYINQSTPRRQITTTYYTSTKNVNKRNSGETNQSAINTTTSWNVNPRDSDISEQLRKQVASGSITVSRLKESKLSKENCHDEELSVVPEVTPKLTLHYKPSPSKEL